MKKDKIFQISVIEFVSNLSHLRPFTVLNVYKIHNLDIANRGDIAALFKSIKTCLDIPIRYFQKNNSLT